MKQSISKRLMYGLSLALAFSALSAPNALASTYYSGSTQNAKPTPAAAASELSTRCDNFDEAPVFSGGEIRFLANTATAQQQLCGIFKSSDGKVLVVDGGVTENAPRLIEAIKAYGGAVDAWLITHPQDDHVGALNAILSAETPEIEIRNVYFHFHETDWYKNVSPEDLGTVQTLLAGLAKLPAASLHGFGDAAVSKNSSFALSDRLSFRVLNDPLRLSGIYAVNDSSLMYDITMDDQHIIILGDMGPDGGDRLLPDISLMKLRCDYVVMAHHGQNGVRANFYRALSPKACIWSCPDWLFNAEPGNRLWNTAETRSAIKSMGITRNYCTKDGDITLR